MKTKYVSIILAFSAISILYCCYLSVERYVGIVVFLLIFELLLQVTNLVLILKQKINKRVLATSFLDIVFLSICCYYPPSLLFSLPICVTVNYFIATNIKELSLLNINTIIVICSVLKIGIVYTYLNLSNDSESIGFGHAILIVMTCWASICAILSIVFKKLNKS